MLVNDLSGLVCSAEAVCTTQLSLLNGLANNWQSLPQCKTDDMQARLKQC